MCQFWSIPVSFLMWLNIIQANMTRQVTCNSRDAALEAVSYMD